jgi:predicted nucleotide-binding protein
MSMSINEKQEAAIELIDKVVDELRDIADTAKKDRDTDAGFERLHRWKDRSVKLLSDKISPNEGKKLNGKKLGSFSMLDPLLNLIDEANMYLAFLKSLREELEKHPEDIIDIPTRSSSADINIKVPKPITSHTVFIIHGHDELNTLKLEKLLRDQWSLDTVILREEAGKGRTLIEKFEGEAQKAGFAMALLTPDDMIQIDGNQYTQARPNVIFELGWFFGRLGRNKVCILLKEGTKIHSDLDGISKIEFNNSITEKSIEIEKELEVAGLLKKA